jgi:hypothetical protein
MLPNEDMFKMWVANNITDDGEKSQLQKKVMECFNELREFGFFNVDRTKSEEVSGEAPNVKKGEKMTDSATSSDYKVSITMYLETKHQDIGYVQMIIHSLNYNIIYTTNLIFRES